MNAEILRNLSAATTACVQEFHDATWNAALSEARFDDCSETREEIREKQDRYLAAGEALCSRLRFLECQLQFARGAAKAISNGLKDEQDLTGNKV